MALVKKWLFQINIQNYTFFSHRNIKLLTSMQKENLNLSAARLDYGRIIHVSIALPAIISESSCGDVASLEIRWSTCLRIEF